MKEISAKELEEMLDNGQKLKLIDVREENEVALGMIPGSIHIPMGSIVERIEELTKSEPYIFVCRSGSRSGQVTTYLEEQGYDATNLEGGMIDWAGEVEVK